MYGYKSFLFNNNQPNLANLTDRIPSYSPDKTARPILSFPFSGLSLKIVCSVDCL